MLRERSAASPDVITTSKIAKAIKEEDVLMLFPALTITRETAQRGLYIFEASL